MSEVEATPPASPPAAGPDPLAQARKEASLALFALAAMPLAYSILLALLPILLHATIDTSALVVALAWTVGLGLVFLALGIWTRYRLFPATVIGLGLVVVLTLLIVGSGERISLGSAVQLLVQLVLAVMLVKAIRTGWTARRASVPSGNPPTGSAECEVKGEAPQAPRAEL